MRRPWAAGRSMPRPHEAAGQVLERARAPSRAAERRRPCAPSAARPQASRRPCTPAPARSARGRGTPAFGCGRSPARSRAGPVPAARQCANGTRRSAAGRRGPPAARRKRGGQQGGSQRGRAWPLSGAWYAPTKRTRPGSSTSHSAFTSFIIWWRLSCGARATPASHTGARGAAGRTTAARAARAPSSSERAGGGRPRLLEAVDPLHGHEAIAALVEALVHLPGRRRPRQRRRGQAARARRRAPRAHHAAGAPAQDAQDPHIPLGYLRAPTAVSRSRRLPGCCGGAAHGTGARAAPCAVRVRRPRGGPGRAVRHLVGVLLGRVRAAAGAGVALEALRSEAVQLRAAEELERAVVRHADGCLRARPAAPHQLAAGVHPRVSARCARRL